jgi:tetratricopeptide (TPR) repeat protein
MDRPGLNHHVEASLDALKSHDLELAQKHLDAALRLDYEDARVVGMLKYLRYWRERQLSMANFQSNLEKCDFLLQQWAGFQGFVERVKLVDDEVFYAFRQLVFGQALNLLSVYNNEAGTKDPEVLYRVGVCLKGIGNYDVARRFLEEANSIRREDPAIMADLADAYALVEESNLAKVLFREAFFIDAQSVHLETLESEMMVRLLNAVRQEGHAGAELAEWLPVHATLLGVFSVKRELRAIEYGKLLQDIYHLEREFQEGRASRAILVPRLINRYFWLLDHYQRSANEQKRIQETLLKIRSLSPRIHELYTK